MDILASLNEKQKEAVLATEGPVLVIAGAGSGKTRALTHRIAYLIKEKKLNPWNVLAVTFTNKAAGEMKERIAKLLGKDPKKFLARWGDFNMPTDLPHVGTFHAICVRILRKHIHYLDFENSFNIYDTADQLILMKHVMEESGFHEKEINPRAVLAKISEAKNQLLPPREVQSMVDSPFAAKVAQLYPAYQNGLKKNNALDFDDLLMKTVELFQKFQKILEEYQELFRYISVDEYQDTNHAQYVFTNLLAKKYRNLCVIGDNDQSIYGWRGANMQNILDFEKDYPDTKVIKLEENYRSTKPILDCGNAIISKNKNRKKKTLWTTREGGNLPHLVIAENERHEGELIIREILDAIKAHEKPDYRDFVILYRTNAQSRALEEVFMRHGIPYKIVGGIRFYERKEIKDMIAYLRIIQNPHDEVSLFRIVNVPQRNIGPKTLEALINFANTRQITLFEAMVRADEIGELPELKKEKVKKFASLIRKLQRVNVSTPASSVIKHVLDATGYKKFLDDGTVEGEARLENVRELISVASKYNALEPGMSLNILLEEISLLTDLDEIDEKENAVTLMTLHGVKGLEFPWVFICGLEEGLLPHSRSMLSPDELEEERRLFYVGITRAMDRLFLLRAKNRLLYGEYKHSIPSQFLFDIPEELFVKFGIDADEVQHKKPFALAQLRNAKAIPMEPIEPPGDFRAGDKVRHRKWGEGVVINLVGGIVVVAFKDPKIGVKKLAVSVAPLEKLGLPDMP